MTEVFKWLATHPYASIEFRYQDNTLPFNDAYGHLIITMSVDIWGMKSRALLTIDLFDLANDKDMMLQASLDNLYNKIIELRNDHISEKMYTLSELKGGK